MLKNKYFTQSAIAFYANVSLSTKSDKIFVYIVLFKNQITALFGLWFIELTNTNELLLLVT